MLKRFCFLALGLAAVTGGQLVAQTTPDWVTRILEASNLPVSTSEARKEGASNQDIGSILDVLKKEKVPADEATRIVEEERAARRDHGPVDNFGAFVQEKLHQGLRGQDLAAAIRAEHAARGKGKGYDQARDREGQGKGDERGKAVEGKKPPQAGGGPDAKSGKPEGKGKPEEHPAKPRRR